MSGLSVKELLNLNSLLSSSEQNTFENIHIRFTRDFTKDDHLRIGLALMSLLYESDLLVGTTQRLVVYYLLNEICKPETGYLNAFTPVFLKLLEPTRDGPKSEFLADLPKISPQERFFISSLLTQRAAKLVKRTPAEVQALEGDQLPSIDISSIRSSYLEQLSRFPHTARCAFPSTISIPSSEGAKDPQYSEQQAILKTSEEFLGGVDAPAYHPVRPNFARLMPPLHTSDGDYAWIDPVDFGRLMPIWCNESQAVGGAADYKEDTEQSDEQTSSSDQKTSECTPTPTAGGERDPVELMRRALNGQLQLAESQWLIEQLKADGSIVQRVNMTPDKLPKLVEDNPMVAVEVLLILLPSKEITNYFEVLVSMELSVHGMEVVNRLTSMVDVPEEFLNVYVTECIAACENIKDSPFTQNRLVRMVCVFLSSLIRNRLINVKDLFIELQAFCINFNSVREAAALYQTVQMMNPDRVKEGE